MSCKKASKNHLSGNQHLSNFDHLKFSDHLKFIQKYHSHYWLGLLIVPKIQYQYSVFFKRSTGIAILIPVLRIV